MSGVAALERMTRPKTVAIVGGSADPSRIAGRPVKFLRYGGFTGEAYLVNPNTPVVEGFTSVASVGGLPQAPDVAFVATGAKAAVGAVGELAALGTPGAIVLASGYAETGPEGVALQRALLDAAGPMRIVGPNTLGIINLSGGVFLCASDALETPGLESGRIGVASQSGGIMASLLSRAAGAGIGFSKLFATGNEADIEVSDCVEYFAEDEETTVVALYLETLRDPDRFLAAALHAARRGKRLVCYKVGRSAAGALAASSHTGALAGSDRVFDAFFERAGILRVTRFSELLEVPAALATNQRMPGRRVGILTTTGGAGTLVADSLGALGFELPSPSPAVVELLKTVLPDVELDLGHNPIDLTLAGIREEVMVPVIETLTASDDFDALVVVVGASGVAQPRLVADPLIACAARPGAKPIFAYVSPHIPEVLARLNREGVPAFEAPEGCAAALDALVERRHGPSTTPGLAPTPVVARGRLLQEDEAKALLATYGIASPRREVAATPEAAAVAAKTLGGSLVVKVLAADLAHKSDVGGVVLGVSRDDVGSVASLVLSRVHEALPDTPLAGVLIEEMCGGTEVILGMVRDPALGPTILLGSGGIAAELLGDTALALPPIDLEQARDLIARLKLAPLLEGARGTTPKDVDALAAAIVDFSRFVLDQAEALVETEINPLVVLDAGAGVLALDALVRLDSAT
jgi:acetate---CoA ligase (ADP-forming)